MGDFMKEILNKIRTTDKNMKIENKILNTFFIFLLYKDCISETTLN